MLVLSREADQEVVIQVGGKIITVSVVEIRSYGTRVRLGFEADPDVVIHRREVYEAIRRDGKKKLPTLNLEIPPAADAATEAP